MHTYVCMSVPFQCPSLGQFKVDILLIKGASSLPGALLYAFLYPSLAGNVLSVQTSSIFRDIFLNEAKKVFALSYRGPMLVELKIVISGPSFQRGVCIPLLVWLVRFLHPSRSRRLEFDMHSRGEGQATLAACILDTSVGLCG